MPIARTVVLAACAAALPAQGVILLDAAGNPAAVYPTIQDAITVAPPGSTLVAVAGNYPEVVIDGKAVTLLCEPGVWIQPQTPNVPFLTIRNTSSDEAVYVRGLRTFFARRLRVANTEGPVVVEGALGPSQQLDVESARQLLVRTSSFYAREFSEPGAVIRDSDVVFESCTVHGSDGTDPWTPAAGVQAIASARATSIQFTQCSVLGGDGWGGPFWVAGAPAIQASPSNGYPVSARALGNNAQLTPGSLGTIAAAGAMDLRIDPTVTVNGSHLGQLVDMPFVLTASAALGGSMQLWQRAPAGQLFVLGASSVAAGETLPGLPDPLWLAGASLVIHSWGLSAGQVTTDLIPIPNQPALRGAALSFQMATLDATGFSSLSNPSAGVVY